MEQNAGRFCARPIARYGFTPLDTPAIEAAEVLLAKGGGETEKQIYRFTKGDSDLALRFDLTVPLAKYVALNYGELTFPFRRYPDRQGLPRRARAARPLPRVLSGGYRRHRRRCARHLQRGRDPAIIYDTFTRLGLQRFQHPREQPQGAQRLLRHPRPERAGGR